MSTIVYRYGLLCPDVELLVLDQMRAAHIYRNALTEIERRRRQALRAVDASHSELVALHGRVEETSASLAAVLEDLARERKRTRKRSENPELRERLNAAREAAREARRRWMERRREVLADPVAVAARDRANETAHDERIAARAACGVYWGTYQLIEDADQAGRKAPLWDGDQPNDPRFHGWRGDGAVSAQLIGGLLVNDVMGCQDTQVRIEHADDDLGDRHGMSRRRSLRKRMVLWLRIGSDAERRPVWARWPMILHRPLPAHARVQRVTVHRRMIGPRAEWYATFTLRMDDSPVGRVRDGVVAIDVGWRLRPDGSIRVATVCAEMGSRREYVLTPDVIAGLRLPEQLRATRDRAMDAARAALLRWLTTRNLPDEWREATKDLARWRSAARLAGLALWWRSHPLPDDDVEFWALENWRYRDWHLWAWETSQRTGALRRRRDLYRVLAVGLAEHYGTLIMEDDPGLKQFAQRPQVEDDAVNEVARSNRVVASISELRACLSHAFNRPGHRVVMLPAANTTMTCHQCGSVESWDAAAELRHRCRNGHAWDQDVNAARNLIERWRGAGPAEPARNPESPTSTENRWQRARRLGRERGERIERSHVGQE